MSAMLTVRVLAAALHLGPAVVSACSPTGANCNETRCCNDANMRCFEKNKNWATCKNFCEPGIDYSEPVYYRTPWTCATVGVPAGSSAKFGCSAEGVDCRGTGCCKQPGHTCFQRDVEWATCQEECKLGLNMFEPPAVRRPWSCAVVGVPAWGADTCSLAGQDCRQSGCCSQRGFTCFQKDTNWATCRETCTPGVDPFEDKHLQTPWTCAPLIRPTGAQQGCSALNDDCRSTGCCLNEGMRCYEKNPQYATCMTSCSPGINLADAVNERTPWTCNLIHKLTWAFGPPRNMAYAKPVVGYKSGSSLVNSAQALAAADQTTTTARLADHWWKFKQMPSVGGFHLLKKDAEDVHLRATSNTDGGSHQRIFATMLCIPPLSMLSLVVFVSQRRCRRHRYARARADSLGSGETETFGEILTHDNLQALVEENVSDDGAVEWQSARILQL